MGCGRRGPAAAKSQRPAFQRSGTFRVSILTLQGLLAVTTVVIVLLNAPGVGDL